MGASNALAAYALYAGKIQPLSMVVLNYMALVSMDSDAEPWWSQGHDVLAEMAMGRDPVKPTGDEKADARSKIAMERAVQRTITPLFDVGAITVSRHSSGGLAIRSTCATGYGLFVQHPTKNVVWRTG